MRIPTTVLALGALLLGLTQTFAQTAALYRWVDDNGLVHYGDHVPPDFADQGHEILNDQGVAVHYVEGTASDEELAERARVTADEEADREAATERARLDRVLLDTYLSVDEIVRLRDQRLDLLEAQIAVTEQYLTNLTARLMELQQNASRFNPRSPDPDAPPIPENLVLDIDQTTASIQLYEDTLNRTRIQQRNLTEAFARDIQRFEELTGS